MRSYANFRTVFSEIQNANPLDAELEPDFNAKWPFKVIQGLHKYNIIIVALNVKVRKIQRAKEAKIAIYDDPTLIWSPIASEPPANIRKNFILLETAIPVLLLRRWSYGCIFIRIFVACV